MAAKQELQVQQKREIETKEEATLPTRTYVPTTDIFETQDALNVVLEMPGVEKTNIDVTVQEVLMESLRQLDELNSFREQLPPLTAQLYIETPLVRPLRDLTPSDLDVLQLAHNFGKFGTVLDRSESSDCDTARTVLKLIDNHYLRVE